VSAFAFWDLDALAVSMIPVVAVARIITSTTSRACRLAVVESLQTGIPRRNRHTYSGLHFGAVVGGRCIFGAVDKLNGVIAKCNTRTIVAALAENATLLAVKSMQLVVAVAIVFASVVSIALVLAQFNARPADDAGVRNSHCSIFDGQCVGGITNVFGDPTNRKSPLYRLESGAGVNAFAIKFAVFAVVVVELRVAPAGILTSRAFAPLVASIDAVLAYHTRSCWWQRPRRQQRRLTRNHRSLKRVSTDGEPSLYRFKARAGVTAVARGKLAPLTLAIIELSIAIARIVAGARIRTIVFASENTVLASQTWTNSRSGDGGLLSGTLGHIRNGKPSL
jgi:hypothetical protein